MRTFAFIAIASLFIAGCSSKPEQNSPKPTPSQASALGTEQKGAHFTVTLKTDPAAPKVGKVTFDATVAPPTAKTVHLDTDMPQMGMTGPSVDLKPGADGTFSGTADLSMGGAYEAKVRVAGADGSADDFTYKFDVSQ